MFEIDKRKKSKIHFEMDGVAKRNDGLITKELIVAEAQKKGTALHADFEKKGLFDQKKAMKFAQSTYARILITQYKIWVTVEEKEPVKVRALVNLMTDRGKPEGGYRPIIDVMTDDKKRNNLLSDAKRELENFRKKYSILAELAPIFEAIAKVTA